MEDKDSWYNECSQSIIDCSLEMYLFLQTSSKLKNNHSMCSIAMVREVKYKYLAYNHIQVPFIVPKIYKHIELKESLLNFA